MIIKKNHSDNYKEKMQGCLEYVESLEEERRKIQVFQRELPLCLELVSQAIETCRKELNLQGQSECSEQTSSEGPVLEEFIPIKRTTSPEHVQNQRPKMAKNIVTSKDSKSSDNSAKKSDWLRSVQLWNHSPDPPTTKQDSPRKVSVVEVKTKGTNGAFHPFKREKSVGLLNPQLRRPRRVPRQKLVAVVVVEVNVKAKKILRGRPGDAGHRRCTDGSCKPFNNLVVLMWLLQNKLGS